MDAIVPACIALTVVVAPAMPADWVAGEQVGCFVGFHPHLLTQLVHHLVGNEDANEVVLCHRTAIGSGLDCVLSRSWGAPVRTGDCAAPKAEPLGDREDHRRDGASSAPLEGNGCELPSRIFRHDPPQTPPSTSPATADNAECASGLPALIRPPRAVDWATSHLRAAPARADAAARVTTAAKSGLRRTSSRVRTGASRFRWTCVTCCGAEGVRRLTSPVPLRGSVTGVGALVSDDALGSERVVCITSGWP